MHGHANSLRQPEATIGDCVWSTSSELRSGKLAVTDRINMRAYKAYVRLHDHEGSPRPEPTARSRSPPRRQS